MSKQYLLVLSAFPDPHADKVCEILKKKWGFDCVRIDSNQLSYLSSVSVEYAPTCRFLVHHNKQTIPLDQFSAVWYRKPQFHLEDASKVGASGAMAINFKHEEWKNVYLPLMHEAQRLGLFAVSNHLSLVKSGYKLQQLSVAKELGLTIPDTLVSCNSKQIQEFIMEHDDNVITKVLGKPNIEHSDLKKIFLTHSIDLKTFSHFYQERELDYPILVQELIPKKLELRITIFGKQVFACSIDSQSSDHASLDWRRVLPEKLPHKKYELPKSIETMCLKLCKYFGLQYGAIDMALTPEGEYVFFEINPNGQYLWVEDMTGLPLSEAMANLLAQPGTYALKD